MVLEVRKDLPANTMPEFVALLKANAGKMQYGSAGAPRSAPRARSSQNMPRSAAMRGWTPLHDGLGKRIPMIERLHEIVGIPFPLAASGKERRNVLIKVHEF